MDRNAAFCDLHEFHSAHHLGAIARTIIPLVPLFLSFLHSSPRFPFFRIQSRPYPSRPVAALCVRLSQLPHRRSSRNESFNGTLRDELLNGEIFYSLKEAQILIERGREHYNTIRPHNSLGYRPPRKRSYLALLSSPTRRSSPRRQGDHNRQVLT